MNAIILLAGNGDRLLPITKDIPKSMVELRDGLTLLEYQLSVLQQHGIKNVIKVVGYKKEKIIQKFGSSYRGLSIKYIENEMYLDTNTAYSLWLTREEMKKDDFILLNGDVLFHPDIIDRLKQTRHDSCLAVNSSYFDEEAVKVITDKSARVLRIGKQLPLDKSFGEFIGVAIFSSRVAPDFIAALDHVVNKEKDLEAYFEKALDLILPQRHIYSADISDLPAIEIDFMPDYERAKNEIFPQIAQDFSYLQ